MVNLLIKDSKYVITVDSNRRVIRDGAVAIDGMEIVEVGKSSDLERKYPQAETIDAKDKLVMPGLFDCHAHCGQPIIRGLWMIPRRQRSGARFTFGYPLLEVYNRDDFRAAMALNCLEYIKSGVVGFCDWGQGGNVDDLAGIVDKSGIRGVLGRLIETPDLPSGKNESIEDMKKEIKKWHGKADDRLKVWFAAQPERAPSVESFKELATIAKGHGVGITTHVAEWPQLDAEPIWTKYGLSPVEFLHSIGWVGSNVDFNHCTYLTGIDMKIIMETNTNVVHCPSRGYDAKVKDMLEMGINVALGADGGHLTNDIFDIMQMENILQNRSPRRDLTLLYNERIIEMATINGAKALMWDKETGSIEQGKKADLIIVNLNNPRLVPTINPIFDIVARVRGSDVDTVIVNGKVIMENRVVKTMDEAKIIKEAKKKAEGVKERAGHEVEWHWPLT